MKNSSGTDCSSEDEALCITAEFCFWKLLAVRAEQLEKRPHCRSQNAAGTAGGTAVATRITVLLSSSPPPTMLSHRESARPEKAPVLVVVRLRLRRGNSAFCTSASSRGPGHRQAHAEPGADSVMPVRDTGRTVHLTFRVSTRCNVGTLMQN